MKKIIALILLVALTLSMASCTMLPESLQGTIDGILGMFGGHTHEFVLDEKESTPATCLTDGHEVLVCSCGEKQEKDIEALGHDWHVTMEVKAGCNNPGSVNYMCYNCGKRDFQQLLPTGHNWEEAPSEPSRAIRCTNEGCTACTWGESNGKHDEALTFKFSKDDEAAIDAKYDEVLAMLNASVAYNPDLHGYAEEGELAEAYAVVDAVHTELYDLIMYAISQRQLAEVTYYCNMNDTALEETYRYMMDYYTAVVAKFYTLSRPFYDSCYREFYYYGMSEEEINAFLFDSDTVSNPEYTALKERNNAIEAEIVALRESEKMNGDLVPTLYAEFVKNNNAMAEMMGYDNYLEYAYENVYGREYTYQQVAEIAEYVKEYLAPLLPSVYARYFYMSQGSDADILEYESQTKMPFFEDLAGNTTVNDYIDLIAFTSNPDKQISFSDEFNGLMGDGNMFRGDYAGAFVTSISGIPIAYFGRGYDAPFTVVHEFGHYMNEVYNEGEYDQSYDLLEMHSQGNELLYLYFLKSQLSEVPSKRIEAYQLLNMLYISVAGMTIDAFEQAVYLNEYDGSGADVIMADGTITYDEYDLLYNSICADFGVAKSDFDIKIGDVFGGYWRLGMTVTSACYYVSYSVSGISVLQLYEMACNDSFDAAKDAYLKLFTYTDENPDMTMDQILTYAGMLSYNDEQLYVKLGQFLKVK